METIKIPELDKLGITVFDPNEEMPNHTSMCVCAMRRSGKSVITEAIVTTTKDRYNEAYLFSTTCSLQDDVFQFIPQDNRYDHVDIEKIEEIIHSQEQMLLRNKKLSKRDKRKNNVLFILDDCISDNNSRHSIINSLYIKGRHIHISVIFISQVYKNSNNSGLAKPCRLNSDIIISFAQPNQSDRTSFIEENMSILDKKLGMELFNKITQFQYCAIVVLLHKIANARSYSDYIRYLKVDTAKKYRKFMIEQPIERLEIKNNTKPMSTVPGYAIHWR